MGCTSLESVILPESVEEIHENAFYDCRSLSSIVLPEGLIKIDARAFCMHVTVRNGKKKTATLSEENWNGEIGLGCEIELEYEGDYAKVADKYGKVQISDL